ncbi:MAG: ACT domain-containing protein, partial [Acidimicrobiia bacterium]|nr:ACT domain-containing protein [Acidimicrobiia bacterium]
LGLSASDRDVFLGSVADELGYTDIDGMFVAVGEHNMNPITAVSRLVRLARPEEDVPPDDLLEPPTSTGRRPSGGIIVEGWEDMLVRIARCCAPVPGDDIVGFVTVGRGVSVHRADCANIGALGERMERIIEVSWAPQQSGTFFVWIQVESLDRPKLLRDVTSVISDLGANIHASSSGTGRDRVAILRYEVELASHDHLDTLVAALRGVDGVFDAYRLVPQS